MIIEYYDELYPKLLKSIDNPPTRLYVIGNPNILSETGIAVIGSRNNTQYGERMCKRFVKDLVDYNINIISGLAFGIDKIAHITALENLGKTIAVLPSGLNNIYPKQHNELAQKIIEHGGAIVSEYEENVKASSKSFLERNRIVAGLAIGTLVIEAGHRSGTSVTARLTTEQGKTTFCIPSSLENPKGITTNKLIQNGSKLVTKIDDILNSYPNIKFEKTHKKEQIENIPKELEDVYNVIEDIPQDINKIARKSGLSISEVSYKLMLLQLENLITELPGQRYIRNESGDYI